MNLYEHYRTSDGVVHAAPRVGRVGWLTESLCDLVLDARRVRLHNYIAGAHVVDRVEDLTTCLECLASERE